MTLGVDVGGTFTDVVSWDGRGLRVAKTSSTPDQSEGVIAGAELATAGESVDGFLHGTTVATNALLERRGAVTALVTSAGFSGVIEIGRQDRPSLYDSFADRPEPLVPRDLRYEVGGEPTDLQDLARRVAAAEPEAVAVSLLYSFADPHPEQAIRDAIRAMGDVPVSLSSDVVGEFREFERTSTTVVNAYLSPVMERYLRRLVERAVEAGLPRDILVMRSSGGLMDIGAAAALPAAALLSGPAGGVVASAALGRAVGAERLISFDMGGTSTDVCRIEGGRPEVSYERSIDGYACRMPSVAVHTVGAGGGSMGWVDAGGALRVGPRSAGASPGPACYARGGTAATVTDANVHLGRIGGTTRLAGSVPLRPDLAAGVLEQLAGEAGLDATEAALGIVRVVEAHMTRAIRAVSVEQGADPRSAALVAFGGAGGLHATALARTLEMARVLVPPHAGVFSAFGLLLSPPRQDVARSVLLDEARAAELAPLLQAIGDESRAALAGTLDGGAVSVQTLADLRYIGQSHETTVRCEPGEPWEAIAKRFHGAHRERNGFARPEDPVEIVTVRAEATGLPALRWADLPPFAPSGSPQRGSRAVMTDSGEIEATVWWRAGLAPGFEIVGPAVIEETEATTFIGMGERLTVHESGTLEVEW